MHFFVILAQEPSPRAHTPVLASRVPLDYSEADLLIVMGTSLVVNPFAGLIGGYDWVGMTCCKGHTPGRPACAAAACLACLSCTRVASWDGWPPASHSNPTPTPPSPHPISYA